MTGTLGGVTPVTRVDGRPIGNGAAGKLTKEASDLYLKSVGALSILVWGVRALFVRSQLKNAVIDF